MNAPPQLQTRSASSVSTGSAVGGSTLSLTVDQRSKSGAGEGGKPRSLWDSLPFCMLVMALVWGTALLLVYTLVQAYPPPKTRRTINIIFLCTSIVSMTGSSLLLLSGFAHRRRRKVLPASFHLIFTNAATDIAYASKFFISSCMVLSGHRAANTDGTFECHMLAFFGQVFGVSSVTWTGIICLNIFLMIKFPMSYGREQKKYFPYYHVFVWTLNITLWLAAFLSGKSGMTPDGSCWVNGDWVWAGFGQYISTGVMILTLIGYVICMSRVNPNLKGVFDELTKQCALLGTSFILVNIVQSTFRLSHDMAGQSALWLDHFQAFMLGITGFVNFGIWFPFIIRGLLMLARPERANSTTNSRGNSNRLASLPRGTEKVTETSA